MQKLKLALENLTVESFLPSDTQTGLVMGHQFSVKNGFCFPGEDTTDQPTADASCGYSCPPTGCETTCPDSIAVC